MKVVTDKANSRQISRIWSPNSKDWPALRDKQAACVWLLLLKCGHYVTRYTPSCYITQRLWCAECKRKQRQSLSEGGEA